MVETLALLGATVTELLQTCISFETKRGFTESRLKCIVKYQFDMHHVPLCHLVETCRPALRMADG